MTAPKPVKMTHKLKTWPAQFDAVAKGDKTFELRQNDRGFKVGDVLQLTEWDDAAKAFTSRASIYVEVTYVLEYQPTQDDGPTFGALNVGWCVMSIRKLL